MSLWQTLCITVQYRRGDQTTPFQWRDYTGIHPFSAKVTEELMDLRAACDYLLERVEALAQKAGTPSKGEAMFKAGRRGEPTEFGRGSDFSSVTQWTKDIEAVDPYKELMGKITDIESPKEGHFTVEDLVETTYAFKEVSHAMRGYLLLVDQLGLSRDQKKMVRDMEYAMMAVMKLTSAIMILARVEETMAAGESMAMPELFLPLFVVGGLGSAAMGYGHKLSAGGV